MPGAIELALPLMWWSGTPGLGLYARARVGDGGLNKGARWSSAGSRDTCRRREAPKVAAPTLEDGDARVK